MNILAVILVLLMALLSIVGCADNTAGAGAKGHVYRNHGPLQNNGETI